MRHSLPGTLAILPKKVKQDKQHRHQKDNAHEKSTLLAQQCHGKCVVSILEEFCWSAIL
jgi:hypothetical protein